MCKCENVAYVLVVIMWLAIWPGVILIVVGACAGVSYSSYELSHDRRNEAPAHAFYANWIVTCEFQDGGPLIAVGLAIVIVAAIVRNPVLIMCSVVSKVILSYHRFSDIPHLNLFGFIIVIFAIETSGTSEGWLSEHWTRRNRIKCDKPTITWTSFPSRYEWLQVSFFPFVSYIKYLINALN